MLKKVEKPTLLRLRFKSRYLDLVNWVLDFDTKHTGSAAISDSKTIETEYREYCWFTQKSNVKGTWL